ncbi:MAG: hypothetical protein JW993_03200 [Sedimentisphaerales bacterium]|nr:hypothetical protein [Sedimentisphaerales bacterium]
MIVDRRDTPETQMTESFAALCDLVSAQITCAREGNLAQVEQLCARANIVVARMQETGVHRSITPSQRRRLEHLYEELTMTLEADRADVEVRLRQLRQVKRAVGAYGGTSRL